MNFVFKVAGVGLVVSMINALLRQTGKEDYAQMVTMAGIIVGLMMIIPEMSKLIQATRAAFGM